MTEQTIDVTGLPEGWKAVAYRVPKGNIEFVFIENVVRKAKPQDKKCLIVEKIKPRRIVLEETEEDTDPLLYQPIKIGGLCVLMLMHNKIWRVVEEGERSSSTFRERVVNDLVHNRIISEGG